MARVTVEDCVTRVPNRFELVLLAAQRARDIARGSRLTVERDNDKNPVVALREIAEDTVDPAVLREGRVDDLRSPREEEDAPEEADSFMPERDLGFENIAAEEDLEDSMMSISEEGVDFDAEAGGDAEE